MVTSTPTGCRRSWREVRAVKYRGCWSRLREKKITTEEAVAMSSGMITSGVHTVCMYLHSCGFTSVKTDCLSDSIPPV